MQLAHNCYYANMATRFTTPPTLDRLIKLGTGKVAPVGGSYRYADRTDDARAVGDCGRYFVETDGTGLLLNPWDSDGADLPAFDVGNVLTLTWAGNAYAVSVTLTGVATGGVGWGGQTVAPYLAFDVPANWDFALVIAGGDMTLAVGGGATVGPRKVWARRRDLSTVDSLLTRDGGTMVIDRSRYIIRYVAGLRIGDYFTDEDGNPRLIEGIAKIGRTHLELLGKTFSTDPGG